MHEQFVTLKETKRKKKKKNFYRVRFTIFFLIFLNCVLFPVSSFINNYLYFIKIKNSVPSRCACFLFFFNFLIFIENDATKEKSFLSLTRFILFYLFIFLN
ncbi:hypothetical protein HMI55_000129 [Coelomomyces lativittatus]|nr:hypothetical protein HMI55_000129 [Coelomomyces lativittatus]